MSGKALLTSVIGGDNGFVNLGSLVLHPSQQSRAEIETDFLVVADDLDDEALAIENPRRSVRLVTLSSDPLVPIMVGIGGVLRFDDLQPGILSGWLVEMSVNADVTFHESPATFAHYHREEEKKQKQPDRLPASHLISSKRLQVNGRLGGFVAATKENRS